jgi:excisionase family DNA binding protein
MGAVSMTSKQHQPERDQHHPGRCLPRERASTPCRDREKLAYAARPDHPIMAEILDALARTVTNNDIGTQRRLVEFKDGCRYGKFGKTKAYELIAQQRIRAYKMGGKTMIDLDSVDEFHASLPRVESRAS